MNVPVNSSSFPVVHVVISKNILPKLKNGNNCKTLVKLGDVDDFHQIYPIYPDENTKLSNRSPIMKMNIPTRIAILDFGIIVARKKAKTTIDSPNKKKVKNIIAKLVPVNALNPKANPSMLVTRDPIKTKIVLEMK
jgi:hypothetical protein